MNGFISGNDLTLSNSIDFPRFIEVYDEYHYGKLDKGIRNLETYDIVNTPGKGYKLVQHEDIYGKFKEYLKKSLATYDYQALEEEVKFSKNGAKMSCKFSFPTMNVSYEHSQRGVQTRSFFVLLKHGVDGQWSAESGVGLMDFACLNFEMGGEWDLFKRKHTSRFSVDEFVAPQVNCVGQFNLLKDKHTHQLETPCGAAEVMDYLCKIPKWSKQLCDDDGRKLEYQDGSPVVELNRAGDRIFEQWSHEKKDRGPNVFALSSALTYWSSHDSDDFPVKKSAGASNSMGILADRQKFVAGLMKKAPFVEGEELVLQRWSPQEC